MCVCVQPSEALGANLFWTSVERLLLEHMGQFLCFFNCYEIQKKQQRYERSILYHLIDLRFPIIFQQLSKLVAYVVRKGRIWEFAVFDNSDISCISKQSFGLRL